MLLKENNQQDRKPFETAPEGAFSAVCYRVVDLGTHKVTGNFALDDKGRQRYQHKLSIYFEIEETMSDGRPFMVFETYTASFGEKSNLRRFIKGWMGKDPGEEFDTDTLVGKPAFLNIAHHVGTNGKTYVNVVNAMPLPKGIKPMTPTNAAFAFNITEPLNKELFDSLSEWTRRTIMESKEYKRIHGPKDVPLEDDEPQGAPSPEPEDMPF